MLRGEMKTFFPVDACRSVKPRSFSAVTSRVCIRGATSEHFAEFPAVSATQPQARNARTNAEPAATLLQRITSEFDFVVVRIRDVDRPPVAARSEDLNR